MSCKACEGKIFPDDFTWEDVKISHHMLCCREDIYFCKECDKHLGDEAAYLYLTDPDLAAKFDKFDPYYKPDKVI